MLAGDRVDRRGHCIEVGRPEAAHCCDDGRGRLVVLALLDVVDIQPGRGRRELPARIAAAAVTSVRARISRGLMSGLTISRRHQCAQGGGVRRATVASSWLAHLMAPGCRSERRKRSSLMPVALHMAGS